MSASTLEHDQPPQPPRIEKRVRFYSYQVIGVSLFILIVVLALASAFGTSLEEAQSSKNGLEASVKYPTKLRYKTPSIIEVTVTNSGSESLPFSVELEKRYMDAFSEVAITPQPQEITDSVYRVDLGVIPPRETRVVSADVEAEQYGSHQGFVRVLRDGTEATQIGLKTISFP